MIEFLKDSTFAVNEVIRESWQILKKRYVYIAGMCLLMFVISSISAFLAKLLVDINPALRLAMLFVFITLYFGLQLTLLKYILNLIDLNKGKLPISKIVPSVKQLVNFFIATFYFLLSFLIIFLVILGLVYLIDLAGVKNNLVVSIALAFTLVISSVIGIRIAFFPFFIIDRDANPFQSIKFSLAITRGNFTRVIILLGFLTLFQGLFLYFIKQDYLLIGTLIIIINYFLIVPLSGVALATAYRKMMSEYTGDTDPHIINNII